MNSDIRQKLVSRSQNFLHSAWERSGITILPFCPGALPTWFVFVSLNQSQSSWAAAFGISMSLLAPFISSVLSVSDHANRAAYVMAELLRWQWQQKVCWSSGELGRSKIRLLVQKRIIFRYLFDWRRFERCSKSTSTGRVSKKINIGHDSPARNSLGFSEVRSQAVLFVVVIF